MLIPTMVNIDIDKIVSPDEDRMYLTLKNKVTGFDYIHLNITKRYFRNNRRTIKYNRSIQEIYNSCNCIFSA